MRDRTIAIIFALNQSIKTRTNDFRYLLNNISLVYVSINLYKRKQR